MDPSCQDDSRRGSASLSLIAPILTLLGLISGCTALPDIREQPKYHNPFPQLHRVAILPFFNLSAEPTVNGEEVALAYYNEMQLLPGFEVMPVGVVKQQLLAKRIPLDEATDFQEVARQLGVDAVLVGAVTEYTPYYPPRMGITVNWYAANPGFHPIPAGYGLPWGTSEEEFIPEELVFDAEFALARSQLETQTPVIPEEIANAPPRQYMGSGLLKDGWQPPSQDPPPDPDPSSVADESEDGGLPADAEGKVVAQADDGLPPDWPDPRGFIPAAPRASRPEFAPHTGSIITHTRIYDGHDESFTTRLADYYYFRDDARFGGWQSYLQRSDDFIRFCCYLHLTETLAARGGAGESRVVWRWPIGRYER